MVFLRLTSAKVPIFFKGVYVINFIGIKSFLHLNHGAQLYIGFQLVYLFGALFFTYIQIRLLILLTKLSKNECRRVESPPSPSPEVPPCANIPGSPIHIKPNELEFVSVWDKNIKKSTKRTNRKNNK